MQCLRHFSPLLMVLLCVSCGGRIPSPKTSQHLIQKYFSKYGKQYPETDFGKNTVTKVEIVNIQEVEKNRAAVDSYIYLGSDHAYWVNVTLQKKAFGWRWIAWETLGVK